MTTNTGITGITGITPEYRKINTVIFPPKFEKSLGLGLGFRVRVLIRFICDSYVFAYVVYCILRYSDAIPVISVIFVIPVFVCSVMRVMPVPH